MNDSLLVGDQVSEVYKGKAFHPQAQELLRERVHWICAKVSGERVLDVGCSQGIVPILLAGEGSTVVGVDIFPDAIRYAEEEKAKLPADVAERLSFRLADINSLSPEDLGEFDCLILGEVLEHFSGPERILESSLRFLRPGGQVIITTPFGFKPAADHKHTFTLTDFVETVGPTCETVELGIKGGFICYVGTKRASKASVPPIDSEQTLSLTEQGLLESQRLLNERLHDFRRELNGQKKRVETVTEQLTRKNEATLEKLTAKSEALRERSRANYQLENRCSAQEAKISKLNWRLDKEQQQKSSAEKSAAGLLERVDSLKGDLVSLKMVIDKERVHRSELERQNILLEAMTQSFAFRVGSLLTQPFQSFRGLLLFPVDLIRVGADGLRRFNRKVGRLLSPASFPFTGSEAKRILELLILSQGVEAARAWYENALRTESVKPEILNRIMFDLLRRSHPGDAVEYGDRALALNPGNTKLIPMFCEHLDKLYKRGERELSLRGYRSILDRYSESSAICDSASFEQLISEDLIEQRLSVGSGGTLSLVWKYENVLKKFEASLQKGGAYAVKQLLDRLVDCNRSDEAELSWMAFEMTTEADPNQAALFGERSVALVEDPDRCSILSDHHRLQGNLRKAKKFAEVVARHTGNARRFEMISGQVQLLEEGFSLPNFDEEQAYPLDGVRALYFLHNSLPYVSGGYATRTHGLLKSLVERGVNIEGVTRYGFPLDLSKLEVEDPPRYDLVDGVRYNRLLTSHGGYGSSPLPVYLADYLNAATSFARSKQPTIVHGASSFLNGVVATGVARKLGLPSVYEVRGLWEITRMSRQPSWGDSEYFEMQSSMETRAAQDATAVIAITGALKDELVRRGIPAEKVHVVPNGVDPDRFVPCERDLDLAAELQMSNKTVIGYVGSVVDYEGLDYVLEAARVLKDQGRDDFAVLMVGDGAKLNDLKELSAKLELDDIVHFAGRVPHQEVERYYSVIDIAPFPRRGVPVCEMVSPMKPFEAMSMRKAVVASDVAALKEIVIDGEIGLLHKKDDPKHLARVFAELIDNEMLRRKLGENGRKWVIENRNWRTIAGKVEDLYHALAKDFGAQRSLLANE